MITVSIIVVLALATIPGFRNYDSAIQFKDKVSEIEALVNEMGVKLRNPEKDVSIYILEISGSKFSLQRADRSIVKEVALLPNQNLNKTLTLTCSAIEEKCSSGNPPVDISTNLSILSDSSTDPAGKATFILHHKPLRVTVAFN